MNTAIVLVLAVVCFFIGIIASYLMQSLREESRPAQVAPSVPDEGQAGEELLDAPAMYSQVSPAAEQRVLEQEEQRPPPPGMIEVARFYREETSQIPILEMDGHLYHKADEMSLAKLDKLEAALRELSAWVGKPILTERASIDAGAFLVGEGSERPNIKPIKMGPLDIIKNTLDADVRSALKSAPKSLAAQVDEILQTKLVGSGLADRGIRIMDTPSADLVVMVGLEKYDGVEAVPDADIQAVIREAVAEWGRRASLEGGAAD